MLCVLYVVCPVYVMAHKSDNKPGAAALPLTRQPNVDFDQATSRKRDDGKAKTLLYIQSLEEQVSINAHICVECEESSLNILNE